MPNPTSEVTVHRQTAGTRRVQAKAARKRRRLTRFKRPKRLSPRQKAAVRKRKGTGFYKKIARLRSSLDLPATITGSISHNAEFIDLVIETAAEMASMKDAKQDARAFAKLFIEKDPAFSNTDTGMTAILFEAYIFEKAEEVVERFLETQLEGSDTTFLAIFEGLVKDEPLKKLATGVASICTFEVLVKAGDTNPQVGIVSDMTILECTPKRQKKTRAAAVLPEPAVRTEGLLPVTKADYEAVLDEGGITDNAFMYLYPTVWEAAVGRNGDIRTATESTGVKWYCHESVWLPDLGSIEEDDGDEEEPVDEAWMLTTDIKAHGKKYTKGKTVKVLKTTGQGYQVELAPGVDTHVLKTEIKKFTAKAAKFEDLDEGKGKARLLKDLTAFMLLSRKDGDTTTVRNIQKAMKKADSKGWKKAAMVFGDPDDPKQKGATYKKARDHWDKLTTQQQQAVTARIPESIEEGFEALFATPTRANRFAREIRAHARTIRPKGLGVYYEAREADHQEETTHTEAIDKLCRKHGGKKVKAKKPVKEDEQDSHAIVAGPFTGTGEPRTIHNGHCEVIGFKRPLQAGPLYLESEEGFQSKFLAWTVRRDGTDDGKVLVHVGTEMYRLPATLSEMKGLLDKMEEFYEDLPDEFDRMVEAFLYEYCEEKGTLLSTADVVSTGLYEALDEWTSHEFIAPRDTRIQIRNRMRLLALGEDVDTTSRLREAERRMTPAYTAHFPVGSYKEADEFQRLLRTTTTIEVTRVAKMDPKAGHVTVGFKLPKKGWKKRLLVLSKSLTKGDSIMGPGMRELQRESDEGFSTDESVLGSLKIMAKDNKGTLKVSGKTVTITLPTGAAGTAFTRTLSTEYPGIKKGSLKVSNGGKTLVLDLNDAALREGTDEALKKGRRVAWTAPDGTKMQGTVVSDVGSSIKVKVTNPTPKKGEEEVLVKRAKLKTIGEGHKPFEGVMLAVLNEKKEVVFKGDYEGCMAWMASPESLNHSELTIYGGPDTGLAESLASIGATDKTETCVLEVAEDRHLLVDGDDVGQIDESGFDAILGGINISKLMRVGEKATTRTVKCPECDSKVLAATGYCVKCKKKTITKEDLDEAKLPKFSGKRKVKITGLGKTLAGKPGPTGAITDDYTHAELLKFVANTKKKGKDKTLRFEFLDGKKETVNVSVMEAEFESPTKLWLVQPGKGGKTKLTPFKKASEAGDALRALKKKGKKGVGLVSAKSVGDAAAKAKKKDFVSEEDLSVEEAAHYYTVAGTLSRDELQKKLGVTLVGYAKGSLGKGEARLIQTKESIKDAATKAGLKVTKISKAKFMELAESEGTTPDLDGEIVVHIDKAGNVVEMRNAPPDLVTAVGELQQHLQAADEARITKGDYTYSAHKIAPPAPKHQGKFIVIRQKGRSISAPREVWTGSKWVSGVLSALEAQGRKYDSSRAASVDMKKLAESEGTTGDDLDEQMTTTVPGVGKVKEPTHMKALARKAGKSGKKALELWGKAQGAANKQYPELKAAKGKGGEKERRYYKVVTAIFKKMLGLGKEESEQTDPIIAEMRCHTCRSTTEVFLYPHNMGVCGECGSVHVTPTGEMHYATEEEVKAADPKLLEVTLEGVTIGTPPDMMLKWHVMQVNVYTDGKKEARKVLKEVRKHFGDYDPNKGMFGGVVKGAKASNSGVALNVAVNPNVTENRFLGGLKDALAKTGLQLKGSALEVKDIGTVADLDEAKP